MAHDAIAMRLGAGLAKAVVGRGGEFGVFGVARGLAAMRAFNHYQLQACGLHSGNEVLRFGGKGKRGVAMGADGVHKAAWKWFGLHFQAAYWVRAIRQPENPKAA